MPLLRRLLPILFLPLIYAAPTPKTVTVDDTTGVVTKSGSGWTSGGAWLCGQYTQGAGDSITFRFTGTDFTVRGSGPSTDNVVATLDGNTIATTAGAAQSLPGRRCTDTIATGSGLAQVEHTLVLTFNQKTTVSGVTQYLVVQDIVYTSDDSLTTTTAATTAATTTGTTTSATAQAAGATSPANTASNPPSESKKKNTGAVAGGAVAGSIVGIILAVLAFLHAKYLIYLLASLAFLLTGWWFFGRRRLNFYTDKDVGQIQITLFLSPHEVIRDSDENAKETLLAWQVFDIGHSKRDFNIICPCVIHTGDTKFGFGTVTAEKEWITSEEYHPAPAIWADGQWEEHDDKTLIHPVATNNGENMDIALGTFEDGKEEHIFKPFVLIKDIGKEVPYTYEEGKNLYLHIFLTNGYREGRYAKDLVSKFNESKLTERGIKLVDLKPISQWHIKKDKGKIVLAKIRGAKKGGSSA